MSSRLKMTITSLIKELRVIFGNTKPILPLNTSILALFSGFSSADGANSLSISARLAEVEILPQSDV